MFENVNQWYTLHTKPKAEFRVAYALEEAGLEVYLPELHIQQNNKLVKTSFFPCYLFMATNLNTVSASVWQWTPGLRYLVTCGNQPICVPPEIIRLIKVNVQGLNKKNTNTTAAATVLAPGDIVRITSGPLKEMIAIFEGPAKPARRVQVLLQMLDYQRRVQLNVADIEKVSDWHQGSNRRQRRTRGRGRFIAQ